MRKLLQSDYVSDPGFGRARHEQPLQEASAPFQLQSRTSALTNRTFISHESAPRPRCGLAYAAGYAGLIYLFRFSFAPFVFGFPGYFGGLAPLYIFIWGMAAPVALGLAFAAAITIDRTPEETGRLPALLGLVVGLGGTFGWLVEAARMLNYFD